MGKKKKKKKELEINKFQNQGILKMDITSYF